MTLTDWIELFEQATMVEPMTASEQAVWLRLLFIDHYLMWREWFECSDARLKMYSGVHNKNTLAAAKDRLRQRGWIVFKPSGKTTCYKLTVPDYLKKAAKK